MIARALILAALAAGLSGPGAAQTAGQDGPFTPREEQPEDFAAGPGRDDTFYMCSGCHGFRLVAQQGQSRRQWDDTIEFMVARHGMPQLDPETRKTVLDYLEAAYPPRTAPRGFQNPFLPR